MALDKTYKLHFSTNAICELEDKLDRSFIAISGELAKGAESPEKIRMTTLRAILWAGLQDYHPEIDIKAAGKLMVAAGGMVGVMKLISDGFARAFPDPETKDARPPQALPQGNGKEPELTQRMDGTGSAS